MAWTLSAFADECAPEADAQIAALVRAGYKHIDIRTIDGVNISVLPLDHARRIRAKLDAAGISCAMLGSPIGKIDIGDAFEGDLEKLRHLGTLAAVLNCRAVRIFSYFNVKQRPREEFRTESLRRLFALRALARELNLTLYHENESHIFGDAAADVLTIAQQLRDPGVGSFKTIFDFGNFNAARENVWDNWVKLREHTDGIHLKDNVWSTPASGGAATLMHVPLGQGSGFVKEIVADAVKRRFSGPVSVEPHLLHSPAVAATGPSGVANQAYTAMTAAECFGIACAAARDVLVAAGAVID